MSAGLCIKRWRKEIVSSQVGTIVYLVYGVLGTGLSAQCSLLLGRIAVKYKCDGRTYFLSPSQDIQLNCPSTSTT